ncbi:MAG: LLM class flavin-dependent oxidoreductase [Dehalococcoidia bacterium]
MSARPRRMSFGIFIAPWHRVGENPTLCMKRDLELIVEADRLGYDEAWVGEHHSFARELIADPCLVIAAAAQVTRRIKIGTGVLSLPYHHPLMVADRMLQLDHMTEGRAILGVGPGALTSDAYMMGIQPEDQRRKMAESLDAIMKLLEAEAPVSMETDWFTLREARLQMASLSDPHLPVYAAATFTPTGPIAAGKHGIGLLSVAGANNAAFERTWGWVEEAAAEHGKKVSRQDWRVVQQMHLADSKREALDDLRETYLKRAYWGDRSDPEAPTQNLFAQPARSIEEAVENGGIIAGTPDDAVAAIERLQERSGGIGGVLFFNHEWAGTQKTIHSYELFQRYVAPRFQGQMAPIIENRDWIEGKMNDVFGGVGKAYVRAFKDLGKDVPPELTAGLEAQRKAREAAAAATASGQV